MGRGQGARSRVLIGWANSPATRPDWLDEFPAIHPNWLMEISEAHSDCLGGFLATHLDCLPVQRSPSVIGRSYIGYYLLIMVNIRVSFHMELSVKSSVKCC